MMRSDNKISLKKLLDISAALSAAMSLLMAIAYVRPIYSVAFTLAIAASFFVSVRTNIATVAILAATFATLRRGNIFEIMMEAILIMLSAKMTGRKASRDYPQIALLSLMMLVCFSMLSVDKSFLFFCFGIGFLSSFMLILSSWLSKEPESMLSFSEIRQIILRTLGMSGLMLPVCVIIFFSVPRIGSPFFGVRNTDDSVTGFSEQVRLGDVSQIQKSGKLAFRAVMERQAFSNLYWRGIVFDLFDGNSWSRTRRVSISKPQPDTQTINQEIILEPGRHRYLLALDMPLSVSGKITANVRGDGVITYDGMRDGKRISYHAVSAIPKGGAIKAQIERVSDYIRLPKDFSPRLQELTNEITSGKNYSGRIDAVLEFLSSARFGYALSGLVRTPNALEDFIFGSGQGSCEYFASAMGVMLRMAGIPTRLVGGYSGGIYNDSGGYYSIFEEQAHVWVEAWDNAKNEWVRYDPTPAVAGGQSMALEYGFWEKYIDILDYKWTNFIINYNLETQREMIREIMEGIKNPSSFINSRSFDDIDRSFFIWLAVITGIVLSLFVFFKRVGHDKKDKKESQMVLQKFLRIMKKRGYDKKTGEGLEEFLSTMDGETREKAAPFVRHFQEIYFKDMPMDKEIKKLLKKF